MTGRLLFVFLALFTCSELYAQWAIGPEKRWSSPGLAPAIALNAALASNGDDTFAVWSDRRFGNVDVYGTALDAHGRPGNEAGLPLGVTYLSDDRPQLVWNGSEYLLAWTSRATIHLARLSRTGAVLGGTMLTGIADFNGVEPESFAVAWNGSAYLIAWAKQAYGAAAGFALLRPDLTIVTTAALEPMFSLSAASNGDGFMLVGAGSAVPISAAGIPGARVEIGVGAMRAIASNGGRYFVVGTSDAVAALVLNADGTPAGPAVRLVENPALAAAAAWDGIGYTVVWSDLSFVDQAGTITNVLRLRVARFTENGEVMVPPREIASGFSASYAPALAVTTNGLVVLWREGERQGPLFSAVLNPASLETEDVSPVALAPRNETAVRTASGTTTFAAIWSDGAALRFGRVTPDGVTLDGDGVILGMTAGSYDLAFADGKYLAVWGSPQQGSVATRITESGEILDATPLPLGPGQEASIAGAESSFLVVMARAAEGPSYPSRTQLIAVRVGMDGTTSSHDPFPRVPEGWSQSAAVAGKVGPHYLVAYTETRCGGAWCHFEAPQTRLIRISENGTAVGEPTSITAGRVQAFASKGDEALLLYSTMYRGDQLWGVFVGSDGAPTGDPFLIESEWLSPISYVALQWNGHEFLAAYQTYEELRFARIGTDAAVKTSLGGRELDSPDLAAMSNGRAILSYTRVEKPLPEAHDGTISRAVFRVIGDLRRRAIGR